MTALYRIARGSACGSRHDRYDRIRTDHEGDSLLDRIRTDHEGDSLLDRIRTDHEGDSLLLAN